MFLACRRAQLDLDRPSGVMDATNTVGGMSQRHRNWRNQICIDILTEL